MSIKMFRMLLRVKCCQALHDFSSCSTIMWQTTFTFKVLEQGPLNTKQHYEQFAMQREEARSKS